MTNLSDHFAPAELLQLHAEIEAFRRQRRKGLIGAACFCLAASCVVGAVVWGVW